MATTPFEPSHPAVASLFEIYNDATATPRSPPGLPCGGCNFADPTPGANGLRCGCRRFWPRHVPGSAVPDQAGWCMCNHHACYHDQGLPSPQPPSLARAAGQENERPATGREPLSPMPGVSMTAPPALPGIDFASFADPAPLSFIHDLPDEYSGGNASQLPGSLPDTLAWGDMTNSPAPLNPFPLPPIPSQCLIPSQTASTAPSVQARYMRPFAGKGLQTLGSISDPRARFLSQQPADAHAAAHAPDASPVLVRPTATPRPGTATHAQPGAVMAPPAADPDAVRDLAHTVGEHTCRLDRLETVSFHEECHDKMENLDVRMSELESRVDEAEKLANDNASVVTARAARDEDAATQSVVSASFGHAARPQPDPDVMGHLHSLQAQVALLQSYLPTPSRPWVVEVVFLPFPLKRLWQDFHQFRSDAAADGDDWTQLPMTLSTATRRSQSPFCSDWAASGHDADRLLPRACSNTSVVDKRLRSRGLIHSVSVRGPDYRSVQAAVHGAFGSVFREMRLVPRAHPSDASSPKFLGLHQQWVPLRKVHKDSRLRFLSPAEMMTPGLWDVQFLSSVMMRSSEPRLFITHPDAYLQDAQAYAAGWTWQRVREMTRVYPDVTAASTEVPEADALEEHWAWSGPLDEAPPPARASLGVRRDRQRLSTSPLLARGHGVRSWRRSMSPVVTRGPSPLTARWRDSAVPPLARTVSVPVAAPVRPSPMASGRRVVSNEQGRRLSPTTRVASQARITKKRRTRSPGHRHLTPRWTASPSPMLPSFADRYAPRGTTPFAYATPHSNAPLQEIRLLRGSSSARTGTMHAPEPGYVLPDVDLYGSESDESLVDGDDEGEDADDDDDEDEDDEDDEDDDDDDDDDGAVARGLVPDSQQWHLPEDEPWPGIEDQDGVVADGENAGPRGHDDDGGGGGGQSTSSSQPSEYPSTNRPRLGEDAAAFRIHEDDR